VLLLHTLLAFFAVGSLHSLLLLLLQLPSAAPNVTIQDWKLAS
jgi:hypothetical protein